MFGKLGKYWEIWEIFGKFLKHFCGANVFVKEFSCEGIFLGWNFLELPCLDILIALGLKVMLGFVL